VLALVSAIPPVVELRDRPRRILQHNLPLGTDMRWPLRQQLVWPLVAVAAASLAAICAVNGYLAAQQTRSRIDRQLQGVIAVLRNTNFPLSDSVLRQMRDLSGAEFILTDQGGRVIAASLIEPPRELTSVMMERGPQSSALNVSLELNGVRYFHSVAELAPRGQMVEPRKLHVLFPASEYRRNWREAFLPPLVIGAASLAAVVLVASLLARRISRASSQLGGEMLRIARGDFAEAPLPEIDDEIRDLSLAVNRTARMLADYHEEVKRNEQMRTTALLGAGLAHEMRNAATGCRMALDIHAEECPTAAGEESLAVAKRQLRLMEVQLQRFMRAGKPHAAATRKQFNLAELINELLPLAQPAARHARIELTSVGCDQAVPIVGDQEAIGQVVLNLLLNALEAVQHSDELAARRVEIRLTPNDEAAEVCVSDTGGGPMVATADAVFEPFVTSKPEGIGLGLTVAKQIVEAHAGTISWERRGDVTEFHIKLPLAVNEAAFV
jgi:signal transduction histidine kinase